MGPVGFDLDMTLIDSRPAILASFAERGRETGTAIDLDAVDRRLGIKLDDELAFWYPPEQGAAAAEIYRRHYVRLAERMTTALPGAHEALAAVRAAGQRVVIITAKHPISVRAEPAGGRAVTADEVFTLVHGPEKAAVLRRLRRGRLRGRHPAGHGRRGAGRAVRAVGVATGSFTARGPGRRGRRGGARLAGRPSPPGTGPPASRPHRPRRTRRMRWPRRTAGRAGPSGNRRQYRIRQVPRVDEQRPGHLPDPRPQRGQRLLAVPPGPGSSSPKRAAHAAPEPPRVAAVVAPGRQPGAQLVVVGQQSTSPAAARRSGLPRR